MAHFPMREKGKRNSHGNIESAFHLKEGEYRKKHVKKPQGGAQGTKGKEGFRWPISWAGTRWTRNVKNRGKYKEEEFLDETRTMLFREKSNF